MAVDDVVNFRPGFSLWLQTPIFVGASPFKELSVFAENFDMRIADDGSDYMNFRISADIEDRIGKLNLRQLVNLFETRIAGDIRLVTDTADVVWRGMLKAMILSSGGDAEIRDMDLLANQVVADFSGGTTAAVDNLDSQAYFGIKQIRLTETSDLSLADAERARDNFLTLNAWSRARPYSGDNRSVLSFQFVGYLWLLDWCEDTIIPPLTVKAAIEQVITNCGQGVINFNADSIEDNGQAWTSTVTGTGLELIRKLTNTLDTSGNVWRFFIDNNNIAHFEPVNFSPFYSRRVGNTQSSSGVFVGSGGSNPVKTWTGQAGVVLRNFSYPLATPEIGSPFRSRQDRYIEAIRFNKDGEMIIESKSRYDEVWAQSEVYDVEGDNP